MSFEEEVAEQRPYQLLTSTRYDPFLETLSWNNDHEGPSPFFLLPLHLNRLISATETHNWLYAKSLLKYSQLKADCLDAISEQRIRGHNSRAFKIRITVSKDGRTVVTASPLPTPFTSDPTSTCLCKALPSNAYQYPHLKIYLDKEPVSPSVFTLTKTTFREVYDHAKARNESVLTSGSQGPGSDILMYNQDGQIMETTIFNVAFYRSSNWLTPTTGSGCLPGVMRRWLLGHGRIREDKGEILTKDSIQEAEWVLLFNGVQGCQLGRIYK